MKHLVIIGNGVSGITLARHVRKLSDFKITVVSSESEFFYSRPALMYIYMGHMKFEHTKPYEDWFWKKNRIDLVYAHAEKIDPAESKIILNDNRELTYDYLVLATGSRPRFMNWPGQELQGVQGLVSKQDLEKMEVNTRGIQKAVVTGGGLIGIEMVEMLRSRGIEVHYLIREFKFWNKVLPDEESDLISAHMQQHGVHLHFNTELKEIHGQNRVEHIITNSGEKINCGFLGIAVGVTPNTDLAVTAGLQSKKGFLVNRFFETNIENIYAIGDCAQFTDPVAGRTDNEQIWYSGRMQAETLAQILCGKKAPYNPEHFFNSAKLFDIEYQVYSRHMFFDDQENDSLVWHDKKHGKSIRVFYRRADLRFEGVTLLGVRYRHEVCNRWLREERSVEYVLQHLADANFDPEFYKQHEAELLALFNKKHNRQITLKKKNWKRILGMEA